MNLKHIKRLSSAVASYNQIDFFPLKKNLKGYSVDGLKDDLRAGTNVALLAFPQGMAYALIAGIPIQYGIYGSAVATIVSTFFAGNKFITLGPTNATSVMLGSSFAAMGIMASNERAVMLPLLLLLVGIFLIVGAYFKVANVINFISRTVITSYITAAALLIIGNQLKNVLGVSFGPDENPSAFFEVMYVTAKNLTGINMGSVGLSLLTFILFYGLNKTSKTKTLPNVAITLVVVSVIAEIIHQTTGHEFINLSSIDANTWSLTWPILSIQGIQELATAALAIALLCVLEGTSIGGSLAARSGSKLNGNQEMFSTGMANIGCAFFAGMPASGSLTRSVLSWTSGARTTMASMFNGVNLCCGAFLVGPYIEYIPKAVLAVLVINIGISLNQYTCDQDLPKSDSG